MGKAPLISLWLAIFLSGGGYLVAAAQTPSGSPGWWGGRSRAAAEGNPEHGKRVAESKCAACHSSDGNSADPKIPKLAGQNPAYLYWQLWAFKMGARRSDIMSGIVATLSDSDLADAASFYSRQGVRPDPIKDQRLAAIGERIYFSGVGRGMTPSCAMCHGSRRQAGRPMMGMMHMMPMMGMMGNAPGLNGQHAEYIIDQLNRFSSGERQGMMMGRIAVMLNDTNKKAVAEYLSGLH
jgi:cytochrome c553